ncbi:Somatostatin receptor type 4 [Trichoplax sp. H2]|nr:Somatostatin receptor type 4 [Trichoplax sp. H2]|eukprot:RDD44598.1 Somatostatin receptor type 4 [Trichoplax sp. H2]
MMENQSVTNDSLNPTSSEIIWLYPYRPAEFDKINLIVSSAILIFLCITGTIANMVLLVILPRQRFAYASSSSITCILLTNLALADLFNCTIAAPLTVIMLVADFYIEPHLCLIFKSVSKVSTGMNCFVLTLLSIERYLCIVKPRESLVIAKIGKRQKIYTILLSLVWFITIGLECGMLMQLAQPVWTYVCFTIKLDPKVDLGLSSPLFGIGAGWLTFLTFLAIVTAIVTSIGARCRLSRMIKYDQNSPNHRRIMHANKKINKAFGFIVAFYLLTYLPLYATQILGSILRQPLLDAMLISLTINTFNAAADPLIYISFNGSFRQKIYKFLSL